MKLLFSALFLSLLSFTYAQENLVYQKPSAEILQLADFQRPPAVSVSPDQQWMVMSYRSAYKSLDELNQDEIRLAGLRINPKTNIGSTVTYFNDLKFKALGAQLEQSIKGLPVNPKITSLDFSPDSKYLSFTHTGSQGVELWIVDLAKGEARALTEGNINANLEAGYLWFGNSQQLLINKLPANRLPLKDSAKDLPLGPTVSTSEGKVSQLRTYQDLLKNPLDEANFESLLQSELYMVDLSGQQRKFLDAAMYAQQSFSPDGNYLLVTTIERPFSYVVPLSSFPQKTVVYDLSGKAIKTVNEVPLIEIRPKGFSSTRTGKRSMHWRGDQAASLAYVEALDGGDASQQVDFREELFTWAAPFSAPAVSLVKLKDRYAGVAWGNEKYAFVYTQWYDTRNEKIMLLDLQSKATKVLSDRNSQDVYSDPGTMHRERNGFNRAVVYMEKDKTFWIGDGFTKAGQFPFVEELDLKTGQKKRLYTANTPGQMESIARILDIKKGNLLISLQSPSVYPNYYTKQMKTGKATALTQVENPFQSLAGVHKEVINYKRNDGVDLSGTLYLPAGYDKTKKEKLPLLIWAYPTEYIDKNTAGQITANPNAFTFPSYGSFVYWVSKGYAVLDNAAFPIIGEGASEPNDTFIEQLVANGAAAIDAVDKLGYIDRTKVGVGGHSYGAFMTANLLSHSNLFAVGIARSGAYNRTLTPFGFQREQRNYWDNPAYITTCRPLCMQTK